MLRFTESRGLAIWIIVLTALAANTAVSIYSINRLTDNDSPAVHSQVMITTAAGGMLTLGITGLALLLIRRELARRQQIEGELRQRERELGDNADRLMAAQRHTSDTLALLESFLANAPLGFAF